MASDYIKELKTLIAADGYIYTELIRIDTFFLAVWQLVPYAPDSVLFLPYLWFSNHSQD